MSRCGPHRGPDPVVIGGHSLFSFFSKSDSGNILIKKKTDDDGACIAVISIFSGRNSHVNRHKQKKPFGPLY